MGNKQRIKERIEGMRGGNRLIVVIFALILCSLLPATLFAHGGGFPRLNGVEAGPYRLYAWTQPNPWSMGQDLHLSVAVTTLDKSVNAGNNPAPEILVADATVTSAFHPPAASTDPSISKPLTATESLGGIYYDTDLRLSATGDWNVDVAVVGALGSGSANFTVTVLPGRQINWWLIGGSGALIIVLLMVAAVIGRRR